MSEALIHQQVVNYLRYKYPNVIFRTDFAAGIKMTPAMAARHKSLQAGRAYPDLYIAESRTYGDQHYCGMFLELKRDGVRLYKKDGTWANEHIQEQAEVLGHLVEQGYVAQFAVGFDAARELIDSYLGTPAQGGNDALPF